jgi:hypothetical protein
MLSGPEDPRAQQACGAAVVGLTAYEELGLKRKLREASPSEPWVEAQIKTARDTDQSCSPIRYRYYDSHAFPPGGEETKMIRCPACGIFMPPNAFEHGQCLDHASHKGWGGSPSARAIAKLRLRRLRCRDRERRDSDLLPEDTASLRAEIERVYKLRKYEIQSQ